VIDWEVVGKILICLVVFCAAVYSFFWMEKTSRREKKILEAKRKEMEARNAERDKLREEMHRKTIKEIDRLIRIIPDTSKDLKFEEEGE
jgi:hypothetical protein